MACDAAVETDLTLGWPAMGNNRAWHVGRVTLAVVLLLAAYFKGTALANDSTAGGHFWQSRAFLVMVVLGETAFGIWLLAGCYPRWTWMAAVSFLIMMALFGVFLLVQGKPSCPCFGTLNRSLYYLPLLDACGALCMALFASPRSNEPTYSSARWRVHAFLAGCWLILFPALLNMTFWAHRGLMLELRIDRRLHEAIRRQLRDPSTEDLRQLLTQATGLEFTVDFRLAADQPAYGYWTTSRAWDIMIGMAEKQRLPCRWEQTERGYHLAVAAPWGSRSAPWIFNGVATAGIGSVVWITRRGRQVRCRQLPASKA